MRMQFIPGQGFVPAGFGEEAPESAPQQGGYATDPNAHAQIQELRVLVEKHERVLKKLVELLRPAAGAGATPSVQAEQSGDGTVVRKLDFRQTVSRFNEANESDG